MEFLKTQLSFFFTIKFSENMLKPNVLTTLSFTTPGRLSSDIIK